MAGTALKVGVNKVRGSEGDAIRGAVVEAGVGGCQSLFLFRASEPREQVALVGGCDQACFPQVVFGLEVFDFCAVWTVDHSDGY